ncbi:MAG TPA: chromophore lyase CpcT/CpeT [Vicinamibacteria bacterium]|nr:chromophore lyase CpcT/CpeT [Vicinamibacteria bacterium]
MKNLTGGVAVSVFLAASALAGPPDREVLRVAGWLVGSFDNHAQAAADVAANAPYQHDAAIMVARPIEDPVVFQDALYLYVESRREGEPRPYWQRVYRLKKSGGQVRIEVFKIDAQLLGPLGLDPQMLSSLNPGDLKKEEGCDVMLDIKGDEFSGSTAPRSCRSDYKGSAYVFSTMRVTRDLVVLLDRGYDEKGVQTFGPSDGRGYEFRRSQK